MNIFDQVKPEEVNSTPKVQAGSIIRVVEVVDVDDVVELESIDIPEEVIEKEPEDVYVTELDSNIVTEYSNENIIDDISMSNHSISAQDSKIEANSMLYMSSLCNEYYAHNIDHIIPLKYFKIPTIDIIKRNLKISTHKQYTQYLEDNYSYYLIEYDLDLKYDYGVYKIKDRIYYKDDVVYTISELSNITKGLINELSLNITSIVYIDIDINNIITIVPTKLKTMMHNKSYCTKCEFRMVCDAAKGI